MRQVEGYRASIALLAVAGGAALLAGTGGARAQDPVEYQRICDAYGSGYFYIPGTETCLRIGGYVRYDYERSENVNSIGTGTARYGMGNDERYGGSFGKWVDNHGFGIGGYLSGDYGDLKVGSFPVVGAYFGYDGTWGNEGYNGNVMVGYGGVTGVGFTLAEYDPVQMNGTFTTTMGYGLESEGGLDRGHHRLNLGIKMQLFDSETLDRFNGVDGHGISQVRGVAGLFFENRNTDAYGMSRLTLNNALVPNYYQDMDLETDDYYVGLHLGTKIDFDPCFGDRLDTSLSGGIDFAFHSGSGHFRQETGFGGPVVVQQYDYSDSGLSLGANVGVATRYKFDERTSLSAQLKWSVQSDVTSFYQRASPNGGTSGFSSDTEQSWEGKLRFQRSF